MQFFSQKVKNNGGKRRVKNMEGRLWLWSVDFLRCLTNFDLLMSLIHAHAYQHSFTWCWNISYKFWVLRLKLLTPSKKWPYKYALCFSGLCFAQQQCSSPFFWNTEKAAARVLMENYHQGKWDFLGSVKQ
jgi:hypothetical protein